MGDFEFDDYYGKVAENIIKKQEKIEELEKQNAILLRAMELVVSENEWFFIINSISANIIRIKNKQFIYIDIEEFLNDLMNLCYAIAEYELESAGARDET